MTHRSNCCCSGKKNNKHNDVLKRVVPEREWSARACFRFWLIHTRSLILYLSCSFLVILNKLICVLFLIKVQAPVVYVVAGKTLRLDCNINGSSLSASLVSWKHEGKWLHNNTVTQQLGTKVRLVLSKVKRQEDGVYQCSVFNFSGLSSDDVIPKDANVTILVGGIKYNNNLYYLKPVVVSLDAKGRDKIRILAHFVLSNPPPPSPMEGYITQENLSNADGPYFELLTGKLQRCQENPRAYYTHWWSCSLSQFWLSVCRYICIYRMVNCQEIIWGIADRTVWRPKIDPYPLLSESCLA